MPAIGIIDDKKGQRESIQRIIANYLEENYSQWNCIDIYPFRDRIEYVNWIIENDVAVLILDEQLTGEKSVQGWNVDYDGHDLILFIRETYPTFPVFGMTAYGVNTQDLRDRYNLFEDILEDKEFYSKPEQEIDRFVRSGQRFTDTNLEELNKVSTISKLLAEGKDVTKEQIEEARAIQERLGLPFTIESIHNRSEAVDLLEKELKDFETIISDIQNFLKK